MELNSLTCYARVANLLITYWTTGLLELVHGSDAAHPTYE